MKIAHIGSNSEHVRHFVKAVHDYSITNILVTQDTCSFEGIEKEILVSYRKLSLGVFRKNKQQIKSILLAEKPDVVHIHQLTRLAYFAGKIAKSLNIPIVTTAWGSDVLLVPKKNIFFRFLTKSTLRNSRIATADADVMIDAMKELVPNGVEYIKLQYGIEPVASNESKEKLIFSNRVHRNLYRIDQIIRYFAETRDTFPEFKLVIGASGDQTEELKRLVEVLGIESAVEFVGWLTNNQNRNWYARSQYYISIPESDGTSVSLLEAISGSCIPIVSDLPANREWIEHLVNGIIESNNQNPILLALSSDFGDEIEINSKKITDTVSREVTIPQFISYYERCITRN